MTDRVIGALSVLLLATGGASAGGGRGPDLVETAVSATQRGSSVRVRDAIRNAGTAVSPASRAFYFLGTKRVGTRIVSRLRPGATSRGSKTLAIPSSLAPGSYRLRVCADGTHRIREPNERNNCRAAARLIRVLDRAPPVFAGIEQATTCIPGPIGGDRSSRYVLKWSPAADNTTASSAIVYDVYQATTSGGEDFGRPTYTTKGAVRFTTPPLASTATYYFVVRARDQAGNRDANTVERMGVNLCL